jgi:hypothetical protein
LDDWEAKHLLAADYLCSYAEMTYPRRYEKQVAKLRKKLQIMADYECV